jgi:hypothetical protein
VKITPFGTEGYRHLFDNHSTEPKASQFAILVCLLHVSH